MRCPSSSRRLGLAFFVTLLAASTPPLSAQVGVQVPEPGEAVYEVTLTDGSSIMARVTEVSGSQVVFTTVGGLRIEVERAQIRDLRPVDGRVVDGEYWRRDRSDTRLFFTSTGRTLAKGEAYVGTYVIVLPFVAVGVTDRFTLAGGAPVLFGEFEPFYIAPKLNLVNTESAQISLGTLLFFFDDENVGVAYGAGTFGSRDNALTAGLGFGYSGTDFESQPVAMVGGETRVSRRVKLMTENYFLPGETGFVYSFGLRFIGERLSTDIGIAGFAGADDDGGCCLPMVNFSYAFGGN